MCIAGLIHWFRHNPQKHNNYSTCVLHKTMGDLRIKLLRAYYEASSNYLTLCSTFVELMPGSDVYDHLWLTFIIEFIMHKKWLVGLLFSKDSTSFQSRHARCWGNSVSRDHLVTACICILLCACTNTYRRMIMTHNVVMHVSSRPLYMFPSSSESQRIVTH